MNTDDDSDMRTTQKELIKSLHLVEGEPLSVSDPRDYRRGMLLGFVLVLIGFVSAILFAILVAEELIISRPGWSTIVLALGGTLWVGAIGGAGFLVMHKGKLGLRIIYSLSALFVYFFCRSTVHLLFMRTRDDVYQAIWSGLWLMAWLSFAAYFHTRRSQFTHWWDSTGGGSQSGQT